MRLPNGFHFLNEFEKIFPSGNQYADYFFTDEYKCQIDETCFDGLDEKPRNIAANCIYMFLKRHPKTNDGRYWIFAYLKEKNWVLDDRQVNVWALTKYYPNDFGEKITKILINLADEISTIGRSLNSDFITNNPRAFLPESDDASIVLIERQLAEAGLYDLDKRTITFKGWERIESQKKNKNSKKNL